MKQFLITEQQLQIIGNVLLEMPAKQSLAAIDVIRNLKEFMQPPVQPKPPVPPTNPPSVPTPPHDVEKKDE